MVARAPKVKASKAARPRSLQANRRRHETRALPTRSHSSEVRRRTHQISPRHRTVNGSPIIWGWRSANRKLKKGNSLMAKGIKRVLRQ